MNGVRGIADDLEDVIEIPLNSNGAKTGAASPDEKEAKRQERAKKREDRRAAQADQVAAFPWLTEPKPGLVYKDNADERSYLPNVANARHLLTHHPSWKGVLAFDDFEYRISTLRPAPIPRDDGAPWSDNDDTEVQIWLQRLHPVRLNVGKDVVRNAVLAAANDRHFHSLRDDLERLRWDGDRRLDLWLSSYLGVQESAWSKLIAPKVLISAVARAYKPGAKVDNFLVLEGPQGKKKSTAVKIIAGEDRFTDELSDFGSRDAAMQLQGVWFVELGELDNFGRAEISRTKAFISRTDDRYVPKWGMHAVAVPRGCVFVGTCNKNDYLRDETGNRRPWPVWCEGDIKIDALRRDREQLLAEAVHRFKAGERWWLDGATETELAADEQDGRYQSDAWEPLVLEAIAGRTSVSVSEVLTYLFRDHHDNKHPERWGQNEQNRVARILVHLGWERRRDAKDAHGRRPWRYHRPKTSPSGPVSPAEVGHAGHQENSPGPTGPTCPSTSRITRERTETDQSGERERGEQGGNRRSHGTAGTTGTRDDVERLEREAMQAEGGAPWVS